MSKLVKYLVLSLIVIFVLVIGVFFYASFSSSSTLFGDVVSKINTNEKVVFLTFDDGPSFNSRTIINILNEKDVKATFFILGENVEGREDIMLEFRDAGHDFGTHSMTHPYLNTNLFEEIFKSKLLIEEVLQENITLFRPAYGFRTPETLRQAEKYGLTPIMWSSFPKDYKRDKDRVISQVMYELEPGLIIVLHDHGKLNLSTIDILPDLIDEVREEGYEFGLITNYMK